MSQRYSHRRPRYYDDDESDTSEVDNYPPPKPRASRRDDRDRDRAPRNDIPPPSAPMPAPPPPPPAAMPPTPAQQTSDDDDYDRHRSRRAPPPPRDLEAKNSSGHRKFREKRDGYESDEGDNLRRARKAPPPSKPRGYPDDDYDGPPVRQERSLPLRGKPRDPIDGVEYGGAAVAAGDGALRRRRTYKDPSPRDRQGYDDYDASPRRSDRRRSEFDDPGYRSDHVRRGPSRREAPRPRRDYDDYDDYDRAPPRPRPRDDGYRSGGERRPRPQDYYSDHREDRAPRRGDPRRYPRDDRDRYGGGGYDRYDDRYDDRRRDPRDPRDPRRKSAGGGGWQKEAGAAIMAYAMPTIKKEGTKWAKKELQKFLAARGAGGA